MAGGNEAPFICLWQWHDNKISAIHSVIGLVIQGPVMFNQMRGGLLNAESGIILSQQCADSWCQTKLISHRALFFSCLFRSSYSRCAGITVLMTRHIVFSVNMYARAYLSSTSDIPTKAGLILSLFFCFKVSKRFWQSISGSLPTFWWSGNAFIARLLWCWCLQDVNMTRLLILAVIDGTYSYEMHILPCCI